MGQNLPVPEMQITTFTFSEMKWCLCPFMKCNFIFSHGNNVHTSIGPIHIVAHSTSLAFTHSRFWPSAAEKSFLSTEPIVWTRVPRNKQTMDTYNTRAMHDVGLLQKKHRHEKINEIKYLLYCTLYWSLQNSKSTCQSKWSPPDLPLFISLAWRMSPWRWLNWASLDAFPLNFGARSHRVPRAAVVSSLCSTGLWCEF